MNEQTDPDVIPTSDFNGHRPQADIPFTFRRRLNWGDSDTAEIGYVSKLIDFGQEAVEMWWEAVLGTNWYLMKQDNMANPAVSIQIDFLAPVVVGDRVDVSVLIERLGNASIAYRIEGHKVGGGRTRREVLDFWFAPPGSPERGRKREQWFAKQSEATNGFDSEITERFLATYEAAARGDLDHWADSLDGMVALCILLDQFPRNMFRGTARAFATDARILAMVKDSIDRGLDADLHDIPGHFLYLPFEHSENLADQRRYLELVARWADRPRGPDIAKYGRLHMELIERFGRFPHRNAALGRESTPEELAYLEHPDAGF
jgi:uncharacterized protein (DUF924 family)/acyl-CoA thioesterase FadM